MHDGPRARIAALLDSRPGASTHAIALALRMDDSTADYHLRRLRKEKRVVVQRVGRELCWFNAGSGLCPVLRRMVPALRREETARIALALDDLAQPATLIAERSGVPLGQVRWGLRVLEEAGLATRTRLGRVALAEGAAVCVRNALDASPCDKWGRCPVSQRWNAREDPRAQPM